MKQKIYTIEEIRQIVAPIAHKYNASSVYLFGSYARGEATADSDVDLIIDFQFTVSLFVLAELINELEKALGKHVDVISHESAAPRLMFHILDEEKLIYA